jgi:hypothetical protein
MDLKNQQLTDGARESRRDSQRLSSPSVESIPSDVPASPAPLPSTPAAVIGSYAGCGGPLPSLEVAVSHACDACGGSGQHHKYLPDSNTVTVSYRCPVCQGAGRISDVMPAKDALADAETLTRFANHDATPFMQRQREGWRYSRRAVQLAGRVRTAILETIGLHRYLPYPAPERVTRTARAAFRAVPGLRG